MCRIAVLSKHGVRLKQRDAIFQTYIFFNILWSLKLKQTKYS
jgi:hypothetical protein